MRDKLTHAERRRLEALSQAVQYHSAVARIDDPLPNDVVAETAQRFEIYIQTGNTPRTTRLRRHKPNAPGFD